MHTISGTSIAAPNVAGAAALFAAGKPTRPAPEEVKKALRQAGNTDWSNRDDRDKTKEILVNLGLF
jgi:subtilisin family serine protease